MGVADGLGAADDSLLPISDSDEDLGIADFGAARWDTAGEDDRRGLKDALGGEGRYGIFGSTSLV